MGERSDDAPLGEWAVTSRRGFAPFLASVVPGIKCEYELNSVAEMQRVAFKVKGESGEMMQQLCCVAVQRVNSWFVTSQGEKQKVQRKDV